MRKKEEVEVEATVISKKKRRHRIFGGMHPNRPSRRRFFPRKPPSHSLFEISASLVPLPCAIQGGKEGKERA